MVDEHCNIYKTSKLKYRPVNELNLNFTSLFFFFLTWTGGKIRR